MDTAPSVRCPLLIVQRWKQLAETGGSRLPQPQGLEGIVANLAMTIALISSYQLAVILSSPFYEAGGGKVVFLLDLW